MVARLSKTSSSDTISSSEPITFGTRLRNLIGGRILLKWYEPREIFRHRQSQLSPVDRFLWPHVVTFLGGVGVGVIILVTNVGIPNTAESLGRVSAALIGIGLMFAILFGILDRTSPRVVVKERWIIRSQASVRRGGNVQRLNYADLKGYAIAKVPVENHTARLLILMARDGTYIEMEIAAEISDREIDQALQRKIPRRKSPL
jgi:hypothetical protein